MKKCTTMQKSPKNWEGEGIPIGYMDFERQ